MTESSETVNGKIPSMVGMIIVQAVRAEEVVTGLGKLWIKLEEQQGTSQQFFEPEETLLPENSKELREQCAGEHGWEGGAKQLANKRGIKNTHTKKQQFRNSDKRNSHSEEQ